MAAEDEEPAACEVEGEEATAESRGYATVEDEAENLIGLDEAAENDPLQHYVVLQNQVRRLQEDQGRIERREAKARQARGDQGVVAEMQVTAAREACHGHTLELREVCRRLSDRHERAVEAELQLLEGARESDSSVLCVQSGALLSMFVPESWCLCFTEFFFGDCLPFDKSRPVRLPPQTLMECLLRREELEYALEEDEEVYVAVAGSRWDNPEVTAMFADTIRRQKLLMATKMNFLSHASFRLDLQAIAAAKPEDFLQLQRYATLDRGMQVRQRRWHGAKSWWCGLILIMGPNLGVVVGFFFGHFPNSVNLFVSTRRQVSPFVFNFVFRHPCMAGQCGHEGIEAFADKHSSRTTDRRVQNEITTLWSCHGCHIWSFEIFHDVQLCRHLHAAHLGSF